MGIPNCTATSSTLVAAGRAVEAELLIGGSALPFTAAGAAAAAVAEPTDGRGTFN